ncbi:hypothetical protein ACO0LF_31040 [Undibacterium sp. Di27W]|uniref:hypothetical protein n=1 Tax=Undibacterium sp. Di27W TaxID=3413036 RepID=UPI003BF1C58B
MTPGTPAQGILIVDDNEDAANVLSRVLSAFGHEVVVAYDGATALDIACRVKPQVSLLDTGCLIWTA